LTWQAGSLQISGMLTKAFSIESPHSSAPSANPQLGALKSQGIDKRMSETTFFPIPRETTRKAFRDATDCCRPELTTRCLKNISSKAILTETTFVALET